MRYAPLVVVTMMPWLVLPPNGTTTQSLPAGGFHLDLLHAAGCFDAGDFAAEGLADAVKCPSDTVVYGFCIHLNHL